MNKWQENFKTRVSKLTDEKLFNLILGMRHKYGCSCTAYFNSKKNEWKYKYCISDFRRRMKWMSELAFFNIYYCKKEFMSEKKNKNYMVMF